MIWRYLLYTHVFLATAVVALQYVTIVWMDVYSPNKTGLLLWFTFFSTLLAYNIPVLMRRATITDRDRFVWTENNYPLLRLIAVISISAIIILFIKIASIPLLMLIFPSAVFAMFYSIPIMRKSLNQMNYIKTFVVAGVCTLVTFYMPLALPDYSKHADPLLGLQRFLLMVVLVLPFEVRDIEKDKSMGVVTLATTLGEWRVRYLGLFLLVIEVAVSWMANGYSGLFFLHTAMAVVLCIYYLLFRRTWSDARYMLWGDGMLFIPLILSYAYFMLTAE